jgi:hypothetical protein
MEQLQEEMRQNQGKLNTLSNRRAMEKQMQKPQMMLPTELEPSSEKYSGGGEAGLRRVVGAGRRKKPSMEVMEEGGTNGHMEGGANAMAKSLMQQMVRIHGPDFTRQFMEGLNAHANETRGGAAPRTVNTPGGNETIHARMSTSMPGRPSGGENVPPGGIAPIAYGSPPQAPASFKRNTVGMGKLSVHIGHDEPMEGGRVRVAGAGKKKCATGGAVSGGARAMRGAAISKLMREQGMTLGQASKHLKEHGNK